jgi:hypothetical protein
VADRLLERPDPATHGRLRLSEPPRRGTERASACHGQKDPEVAPFHRAIMQKCMEIVQ